MPAENENISPTYRKPPRLTTVFQCYHPPLYFVTFCTMLRRNLLADSDVHQAFCRYGREGEVQGVGVGNYVIMPDHVHLFVRISGERTIGTWVKGLKRAMSASLRDDSRGGPVWQPGFFDHIVRHNESYSEKWNYVRENPVRKGLVSRPEEWPYSGEIVFIRGI